MVFIEKSFIFVVVEIHKGIQCALLVLFTMRSPSLRTEAESYEQSGSSGGGQSSAKDLYQQRKKYGRSVATMGEISEYRVEVN